MTIGKFMVEKNAIDESPEYQRESGVWSNEKKQLFLDSLFNGFDVPKIYLHDLREKKGRYHFAVIDGKQRLTTIWDFLDSKLPLSKDFELYDPVTQQTHPIEAGSLYSDLSDWWKETFKNVTIATVHVADADAEDIEELFSRLNNGEPLSAAEKRNAKAGEMVALIREIASVPFFTEKVSFANKRLQHHEVAAKFLAIESSDIATGDPFCDLKKKYLDALVENNRSMSSGNRAQLRDAVEGGVRRLAALFSTRDQLLSKQAYPPVYYLFVKTIERDYASKNLRSSMKSFLDDFNRMRIENLQKKEEERDAVLIEYGRLSQQGTNDIGSLRDRVSILRRYFLRHSPDVAVRDKKRAFTKDERWVVWLRAEKKCEKCGKALASLDEVQGDHKTQWAHGGYTQISNGRALCETCNLEEAAK